MASCAAATNTFLCALAKLALTRSAILEVLLIFPWLVADLFQHLFVV